MKNVLVGIYEVQGAGPDCVETPIIGNPVEEHARLNAMMRKKYPRSVFTRTGTKIETRDESSAIEIAPGMTLGQLFPDEESVRHIGQCWFNGASYNLVLNLFRAQGVITLLLRARLAGQGNVRMMNKISPLRLASELPQIIEEVLGREARDIKLSIKEKGI